MRRPSSDTVFVVCIVTFIVAVLACTFLATANGMPDDDDNTYTEGPVVLKQYVAPSGGWNSIAEKWRFVVQCPDHGAESFRVTLEWYATTEVGDTVAIKHRYHRLTGKPMRSR